MTFSLLNSLSLIYQLLKQLLHIIQPAPSIQPSHVFHLSPTSASYASLLIGTLNLAVISSSIKKNPSNKSAPFSVWLLLIFSFGSYLHCAATSSKIYLSDTSFVRDLISARLSLLTTNYPQHIDVCCIQLYKDTLNNPSCPDHRSSLVPDVLALSLQQSVKVHNLYKRDPMHVERLHFFTNSEGKGWAPESQASSEGQGNKSLGLSQSTVRRII